MADTALDAEVDAAVAHHRAGRLDDAEQAYAAILAAHPDNPRALHNYALLLISRGRFEAAEALVARLPGSPKSERLAVQLHQRWGMALMAGGQDAAAEAQLERARDLAPDDPETHSDLGLLRLRLRRPVEARESLERALAIAPGHAMARVNLGSALRQLGLYEAAEEAYRAVLAGEPDHPAATRNLASLMKEADPEVQAPGGVPLTADIAGLTADQIVARAEALQYVGRFAEALACFQALAAQPDRRYDALVRAAFLEATLGRHDDAIRTLDQAIALQPDVHLAYHRRSFSRLRACDYAGGWEDYEHRLLYPEALKEAGALVRVSEELAAHVRLEQLAGRRLLLVAEQGIGDQVMFASMLPDLMRVAGEIIVVCDARLAGLFGRSFPGVAVLGVPGARVTSADYEVVLAMGSLGRLFRNRLEDFPGTPFLKTDPARVARWTERLGTRPERLRIGLSWRGGLPQTGRLKRSLSLAQLAPILALPGCEIVSLQYGDVAEEVAAANRLMPTPIRLFPPEAIDDFDDLAALAQACDVVVSVQNSLVHLCGAIGKDCLTLLPNNPEWRYTLAAEIMPWYRSVRLFRQAYAGDWIPVVQRVAEALKRRSPV